MQTLITFFLIICAVAISFIVGQGYERLQLANKNGRDKVCELYKNFDVGDVPFACLEVK